MFAVPGVGGVVASAVRALGWLVFAGAIGLVASSAFVVFREMVFGAVKARRACVRPTILRRVFEGKAMEADVDWSQVEVFSPDDCSACQEDGGPVRGDLLCQSFLFQRDHYRCVALCLQRRWGC